MEKEHQKQIVRRRATAKDKGGKGDASKKKKTWQSAAWQPATLYFIIAFCCF